MGIPSWNLCLLVCVVMVSVTMSWAANIPDERNLCSGCGYTRYPSLCIKSLTELGSRNEETDVLSALVNRTMSETILPDSNFEKLSSHFISSEAQLTRIASGFCRELMSMSRKRLEQAMVALKESPRKNKQDIQTWLSAALTFQETCRDSADAHADKNFWMAEISKKMEHLAQLSSNSLALANRITGEPEVKTTSGRHLSEETDFPSWLSWKERKLLQATTIKANAIVAKDGSGQYTTISEAVRAASGGRFVIYVKSGVYNERVVINKDGITLIGDGKYSSVISGSKSVAGGESLKDTATVTITGDNFIARDIGIQNTAGPRGKQAVALLIASDHSVLYKCSIAGYQDTLYALSLRQFYRECDIHGTIDFIFGNAAVVFQSCNLVLRKPGSSGAYNVILAHGRTDPGQNTGFSVQNCRITVGSDLSPVKSSYESYLGRPWRAYSRSVVMQSTIDNAIRPRGWIEWPGASSSFLRTLYFAEYNNVGPGAATSKRVQWPGFHVIGEDEAIKFTVGNFIAGSSWLPSTGVTFVSGLQ